MSRAIVLNVASVGSLLLLWSGSASAQPYVPVDMGLGQSAAYGINDAGQVTGDFAFSGAGTAFRWSAREGLVSLGYLPGGTSTGATGINALGYICGNGDSNNGGRGFLWTPSGGFLELPHLGSNPPDAEGINDLDEVVGSSTTSVNTTAAFDWTPDGGIRALDNLPGSDTAVAVGVNNAGQVVGACSSSTFQNSVIWASDGSSQSLGVDGEATAVNNSGSVVGFHHTGTNRPVAYMWTSSGGAHDLDMLNGFDGSVAKGLDETGNVVGYSVPTGGGNGHATIWSTALGVRDLNTLIDPNSGWFLYSADSINASGQIVGEGYFQGHETGFLLNPVPEPATIIVLTLGLVAIARRNGTKNGCRSTAYEEPGNALCGHTR